MYYILTILQTIALVMIIMSMILDKQNQKIQDELKKSYEKTIRCLQDECIKNYHKYMNELGFKSKIRLIMLLAKESKENYFETVNKIQKELDASSKLSSSK